MTGSRYLIVVVVLLFLLVGTSSARVDVIDSLGGPVDTKAPTEPVMVKNGVATATNYAATFEDGVFTLHAGDVWFTTGFEFNNAKFKPGYRADGVDNKFRYIGQFGEIDVHLTEGTIKEYVTVYRASDLPLKHPVTISPGAKLEPGPDGTFILYGPDGEPRVTIQKPFAADAGGKYFPLEYVWDGSTLTTTGNLKGAKFPVVVDPSYIIIDAKTGEYPNVLFSSNDYPCIVYRNGASKPTSVNVSWWNGLSWDYDNVGVGANVTEVSAIIDSNDHLHIAVRESDNKDLEYLYWDGSNWSHTVVATTNDVANFPSIVVDSNNYPRITHCDQTDWDLEYAVWNGTAWVLSTLDSAYVTGRYTSLAITPTDLAYVAYEEYSFRSLKLAYETSPGTWVISTIDDHLTRYFGNHVSLALDSSNSYHISHYDETNAELRYCNSTGCIVVDTTGDVGRSSRIAINPEDYPHIVYQDYVPSAANLTRAKYNGSTWTIESISWGGNNRYPDISFDSNGYEYIAFCNSTAPTNLNLYTDLPAPTASFTANTTTGDAPLTVSFTDTSTGDTLFWQWDVDGDGGADYTTQNCTHTYNAAGNYTVNLTVTNPAGSDTETKVDYITVSEPPATPTPTPTPTAPTPTPTPVEGPNGTWVQQENFTFIYAGNNDPIPWPIWLVVVFITILFFVHSLLGTRYPDISGTIACVLAFTSAWASTMIGYVDVGVTGLNNTTLIIEPVIQTVRPEWLVYAMVMFALVALINNFYLIHKIYLKPKDWESLPRNKRYRG